MPEFACPTCGQPIPLPVSIRPVATDSDGRTVWIASMPPQDHRCPLSQGDAGPTLDTYMEDHR